MSFCPITYGSLSVIYKRSTLRERAARRAKYLTSNNYYEQRLSVNIFASESTLWGAARFLLAAVSRFIGSLKLEIVVDGTTIGSLNSRVFPPRRRRSETGYLQPLFDRGEGIYSRSTSISDDFQAAVRLRDSRKLSICSRVKAIWTRYFPPVLLFPICLFPFSLAANYGILPGGFLSFLQAFD